MSKLRADNKTVNSIGGEATRCVGKQNRNFRRETIFSALE